MPPPAIHMRKSEIVVIAPLAALGFGRTPEFPAPHHQGRIQQPALFQILQQRRHGLVGLSGHADVILFDIVVRIPLQIAGSAAGDRAYEAHAFLHQPPRHQEPASVIIGLGLSDSVHFQSLR